MTDEYQKEHCTFFLIEDENTEFQYTITFATGHSLSGSLRKPPFEMCWFYMGIAQIALDPPMARANVEKKVPQTILASHYTPGQREKKVTQTLSLAMMLLRKVKE